MLLVQHTGNECPNCPRLMDVLRKLAGDEAYASKYLHVASHSYNDDDAAYSSAASTLSRALNLPGYYPWLTFNLTTNEALDLAEIKAGIDELHKDVADAGNGVYVRAGNSEFGLNPIIDDIRKMEDEKYSSIVFEEYDEQFMYFLAIALFFFVLEMLIGDRRSKKHLFNR